MNLTILCDNNTLIDNYLLAEPAFSVYIENQNDKILFDLGYSNVYKLNAKKLEINLKNLTCVAFSHGHDDHTRGLKYLQKNKKLNVYYCEGCFDTKISSKRNIDISSPYSLQQMNRRFNIIEASKPIEISKNLFYLGPIPRKNAFEMSEDSNGFSYENTKDDTALAYVSDDGLIIITGCSHSGICNICDYAKKLFNKEIKLIIGGFHLLELNKKAVETIKYFSKIPNLQLYPCHCTSLHVKSKMIENNLNVYEVGSGVKLQID